MQEFFCCEISKRVVIKECFTVDLRYTLQYYITSALFLMLLCPLETDRKNCKFAWQLIRWNTGSSLKLAINTFLRDRHHFNLFWQLDIGKLFGNLCEGESIRIFDFSSLALILHISQQWLFKQFKIFSWLTQKRYINFFAYAIMNIASALINSPGETLRNRERTEKGSQCPTPVFLRPRPRRTADSSFSSLLVCFSLFLFFLPRFSFYYFLLITCFSHQ